MNLFDVDVTPIPDVCSDVRLRQNSISCYYAFSDVRDKCAFCDGVFQFGNRGFLRGCMRLRFHWSR